MKKTAKRICLLLAVLSLLLAGCGRRKPQSGQPQQRIVTGISVTFQNGPLQSRRQYTSSVKMRAVLNYLRWIDPYGTPAEDPETVEGSEFRIVVQFSDATEKIYLQKADRFMQIDGAPWQNIRPENAMTLGKILGSMESD